MRPPLLGRVARQASTTCMHTRSNVMVDSGQWEELTRRSWIGFETYSMNHR